MKSTLRILSLFLPALLLATPAVHADFYVGGTFGFGFPSDLDDDDGNTIELEDDLGGGIALGYNFVPVRLEGELVFRTSDVRRFQDDQESHSASGSIDNLGVMMNAFYDFHTGQLARPYVGGGFGASRFSAESVRWDDGNQIGNGETRLDDSETVFAYQVMAGIEYEITRNASIRAGYRFFGTRSATWDDGRFDGSRIHIVEVGVRGMF